MFTGSDGTLGIITEIGLRLLGQPEHVAAASCAFRDLAGAVQTVVETLQLGVPVAPIELMDAVQVRACNAYSHTNLTEQPTLLFEFHGSAGGVREPAETVRVMAESNGGAQYQRAEHAEDRSRLWAARHKAYSAAQALRPGTQLIVTDVCVPISRLTDCIVETHADIAEAGPVAPIVGHVGDGNFHVFFTVDPHSPDEQAQIETLNDRRVARALAMDGTCTGEHGIGLGKQQKLIVELGEDTVALMRRLKRACDPAGILNPGKIFAGGRWADDTAAIAPVLIFGTTL